MSDPTADASLQIRLPFIERLTGCCKDQIERDAIHAREGKLDRLRKLLWRMISFEHLELARLKRLPSDTDAVDPKATPKIQIRLGDIARVCFDRPLPSPLDR